MGKFKHFVISQIRFCDFKTSSEICDITKSILMSQNALVVLYVKFSCVKSLNVSQENMTKLYVNNKGAYWPAHLRSLISAFVIRFLGKYN